MKSPGVWYHDEDVVIDRQRELHHVMVVDEVSDLSHAREHGTWLEGCLWFFNHLLAKHCPRVGMNGRNHEDLEGVEALEGSLVRSTRRDKGRQLHENAAFALDVSKAGKRIVFEQR
jgi:hypothetical protein